MTLTGNSILITGGATGIGIALAKRFLDAGSEVAVCGRREDKLLAAKAKFPRLKTRVCDLADAAERESLLRWARENIPNLNVLVNNAGIQRRVDLQRREDWSETAQEIAINLEAPIHLSSLFLPDLQNRAKPAIINVTSGLSFVPLTMVPIYSATKAALHSFTLSLRHQLAKTPIKVIEVIPPAVDTDLGGPGLHKFGMPLDAFADEVILRLAQGESEIAVGTAERGNRAGRDQLNEIFQQMNQRR